MDLATLRDTDFGLLHGAADAYDKLHGEFGQHLENWHTGVDRRTAAAGWTGPAADAATPALRLTTGELTAARTGIGWIGQVLRTGADALVLAQSALRKALEDARSADLTVDEHGAVSRPTPSPADRHDPDHRAARDRTAEALAARISTALAEADTVDRALAARLRHHAARAHDGTALDPAATARDRLDPTLALRPLLDAVMPGADAPPAEVNAWWNGLPTDERQRLIEDRPDLIGNRDGIPATARDQANRILLPRLLARYEDYPPPLDGRTGLKLEGFRRISERLRTEGQDPPVLLLGIGEEGQGRAVLSFGDPDTAQHVTSLVGGMGTELRHIGGGDADRARAVYDAAKRADPTRSTASIAWLGYDAPLGADVASRTEAEHGAAAYQRFLAGQRATHQGAPAHVTAQGHSYGSLLVGLAARRPGGLAADDIVLVGSPGTGADHASDLSVGADHTYVGAARWDYVSQAGWYARDPARADFGAQRFAVPDGSPDGSAHSSYWDGRPGEDRTSVDNIGRIVTGHGDRITREAPRGGRP